MKYTLFSLQAFKFVLKLLVLILTPVFILFYQACGSGFESLSLTSTGQLDSSDIVDLMDPVFVSGKVLYIANCANCHGDLSDSSKRGRTALQIKDSISSEPNMSVLSSLQNLTTNELELIALALNFVVVIKLPPGATDLNLSSKPALGGRFYVASTFFQLFYDEQNVSSADNTIKDIIKNNIEVQGYAFGGSCRFMDINCGDGYVESPDVPMYSKPNIPRSGYLVRTCNEVLSIDKAVLTVLRKSGLSVESEYSASNVQKLVRSFYSGRSVSSEELNALVLVGQTAISKGMSRTDGWRFLMLPMCTSAYFELL